MIAAASEGDDGFAKEGAGAAGGVDQDRGATIGVGVVAELTCAAGAPSDDRASGAEGVAALVGGGDGDNELAGERGGARVGKDRYRGAKSPN